MAEIDIDAEELGDNIDEAQLGGQFDNIF